MSTEVKRGQDSLWLPRTLCAALLGCSASHFDTVIIPLLSASHIRKKKAHSFFAPAVVKAFVDRQKLTRKPPDGEDADLWAEYDSPNLERLRAAKADQAELDVQQRQGKLISVDQWRELCRGVYGALKRHGELTQRQFGRDAAVMHNELIEEIKAIRVGPFGSVVDA